MSRMSVSKTPNAAWTPDVSRLRLSIGGVVDQILAWQERARQRQMLGTFDERQLHDVGLTRADVEREAEKPFWRA
jgi:uncharacterized protein YjiS (DUF1127 family)